MTDGTRVIELHPDRETSQRWDGHLEGDAQARRWPGRDPETVERAMTADLGPLPDGQDYRVREGGAA